MQVGVLAIGDVGKASPQGKDALIEGAVRGAFHFAACRRIGRGDELQMHVEFGVNRAETLQGLRRHQLRTPLGRRGAGRHEKQQ